MPSLDPSVRKLLGAAGPACLAAALALPAYAADELTRLSLEQLLDVNIVGASKYEQKQSEAAAAVSVITREQIQAFGWRTLADALRSLPGVYTTYDRQYTYLGVRGFGIPGDFVTRLKLTINGNGVNDNVYDQAPVGREFPLDMGLVERIEFIPGPGGAVYGNNAMLGVINVVTRTGASVNGVEAEAAHQWPQSLNEARLTWGRTLESGLDVVLSASGMGSRGEDLSMSFPGAGAGGATVSGNARRMDGEGDRRIFARIGRGAWSFDLVTADRRKDDPAGAYGSDPLVAGTYQRDRYALAQLQYGERFAGGALQLSGRLFAGDYRFFQSEHYGSFYYGTASGDWRGGELRALWTGLAGHKLMIGAEGQDNSRRDQSIENSADASYHIVVPGSGYRAGLYLQDEWRLADAVTATFGARLDRDNVSSTQWSPRAGLIWRAAPATTLKALYGRAHRSPNAFERDWGDGVSQVPNPQLDGETIDTFEIDADRMIDDSASLRASVYHWKLRDIVALGIDPASGLTQYQTDGNVSANGAELSGQKAWETGARVNASISYGYAEDDNHQRLQNSPRFLGKLGLSSPLPVAGLRLGCEIQYDGRRLAKDGSELGGHALAGLNLAADHWAPGLQLSLAVTNLFDRHYALPAAPLNWQNSLEQDGRSVRLNAGYAF